MPSHKIHLAIAKKVNEKLNKDLDSLMIGSVLPDLTISRNHDISHYQEQGTYDSELANPDKFIEDYKNQLDNPVMIGYLIHLLTDRFYNDYFFKNHCLLDEKGIPHSVKLKNGKISENIKKYKQSDFKKYDKWLLKHKYITKFESYNCLNSVSNLKIANFDKNFLQKYIKKINLESDSPNKYRINSFLFYKVLNKRELDKMFENCIEYIEPYLKKYIR